VTYNTEMQMLM